MKKVYSHVLLAVISVLFLSVNINAQRTCAAHEHMLEQLEKNPKMKEKAVELENFTQRFIKNYSALKATETRTVPVYVHVIYRTTQENISEAQIQSQITVLNKDYGGTNADLSLVPSEFTGATSNNTGIQFVLAGIDRTYSSKTSWGTNDAMKIPSQGGVAPITPDTHLNMWICNIGGGILGYAQFPGGDPSTDGVVFSPQYCGSSDYNDGSFYLSAPFDKGRTATHEIGHYFNLRHIWGDDNGSCTGTDYVDDTPGSASEYYGCPSYPKVSCSSSDMFMNYMDYVDDGCMFMFSLGQEARMWACLNSTRANLGSSGGNLSPVANANGPYTGDPGVAVSFSSAGSSDPDGSIAGYAWNFGDGGTSTAANPSHTYSAAGNYNVSLTVTDNEGATATANTTAAIGNVCSGIAACDGSITLTLVTDRYASETSWTLKNSAGTTIQSGSGYSNSSTYNINWNLAAGTYTYTINDSYGDGICCSYGNGSYTLKDGCNNTLVTGGNFGSSASTVFCVPDGGTPVNQPPVAEANGPYTGVEGTSISFSSSGSTDADGTIASYLWNFGDGGTSTSANPTHTYANDGSYTATLTVTDDDGATDADNAAVTVTASGGGGSVVLSESYFESGWDSWTDGGSDVARYSGSRSYEGSYSIYIRDNSGTASRMSKTGYNLTSYNQVVIDFYFYSYSMETGEDFFVLYYNGSSWQTVADYARGTDFNNNTFYHVQVTLNSSDYNFASNSGFAFQCDASNDADLIYIDAVTITGISSGARVSGNSISAVENVSNAKINAAWNEDLLVYPNPVREVLNVNFMVEENTKAEIYNLKGALIKTVELVNDKTSISVNDLKSGVYILKVRNSEETVQCRFIKE